MSAKTEIEPTFVYHIDTRRVKKAPPPAITYPYPTTSTYKGGSYPPVPTNYRDITKLDKDKYLEVSEWRRRDNIIKACYAHCKVKVGERVRPMSEEQWQKYGPCFIRGIDKSWDEYCGMEKDETAIEWPADNTPFIVHAQPIMPDRGGPIIASARFFRSFYLGEKDHL